MALPLYVLPTPNRLELPDGACAEVVGEALELRDATGALLVRYRNGSAEVHAPSGDLTLAAPHGRVRLSAALDVEIDAARDLVQRGGRDARLDAGRSVSCAAGTGEHRQLELRSGEATLEAAELRLRAGHTELTSGRLTVVAHHISHTASVLAQNVERYELVAERLVEKTRHSMRDVAELLQTRAGRVRTVVRSTFALWSKRTTLRSQDDTSIDGRKVLLG